MKWAWIPALLIGMGIGYVSVGGLEERPDPAVPTTEVESDEGGRKAVDRTAGSRDLDDLRRRLAAALDRASDLEQELREARESATPDSAETRGSVAVIDPVVMARADATFAELTANGDLEGLWLFGAELLQQGEPGYAKLTELLGEFEQLISDRTSPIAQLIRDEELFVGRFMRALGENDEGFLKYGLYLKGQNPESLPRVAKKLRGEMADELGAILLGYYRGDDAVMLNGYVEWFRESDPELESDEAIQAISQIPTEAATRALVEYLDGGSDRRVQDAIRGLAWSRLPGARLALERFQRQTDDPELLALIEQALRSFE